MAKWRTETVEDCLVRLPLAAIPKLQTRDYHPSGRHPIIDQGQSLIAGWTDDESGLIAQNLPVVVFGDHTRAFKFVDFPFVRGADGTQVLKPKPDIDPLFFYYALRALDLPTRGYNRHFKALKEKEISVPSRPEQNDIGRVLKAVEGTLNLQDEELAAWDRCKRAAMRTLFTRGLRGEPEKETEIGLVPESWKIEPLDTHFSAVSGGTPSRGNPSYWTGGVIPWVKTTEVNYCVIEFTEEHITDEGLNNSAAKLLPAGTLLLAMYGQGVTRGKVAILGIDAACNQACAAMNPRDDAILTKYLYHFLTSRYEDLRQLAHGGQQQNLNLDIVRAFQIAYPIDVAEQQEIVGAIDAIDRKIGLHRRKRAVLDELFKSLLHKLVTGEIQVGDLDLSALDLSKVAEVAA
ncbi:restriction endonuclease subunit S [Bradyrhizobium ottawaense]|uniref:Restriction endonuclease subunit S n=1 Tax=Bradyrhizobium ottawaense TaxID=931866 RepID=A0A2U8PEW0_9BRAD|nr:restriction endonuclease subunit S [Bradyrhizobium ottawaense]AWL96248.1 restriction endonuclease subunit S [Bradyrhizobium ottawaense]